MEILAGKVIGFVLVITRVGAFFATAPVFSWSTIPIRVKVALTLMISMFFAGINTCAVPCGQIKLIEAAIFIANEAIYGLALGYIAVVLFSVVKIGARIIERQMGLAMASVLDPLTGEQAQPLGMLVEMIFILLLLAVNGHHLFLMAISKSYGNYPIGAPPAIGVFIENIIIAGSTMMLLCLKMSAPMLAAFMVLMVVLAILARIAPETNVLFLSLPARVGLGLLMMGIFLPFVYGFIEQFALWMDKLLPL